MTPTEEEAQHDLGLILLQEALQGLVPSPLSKAIDALGAAVALDPADPAPRTALALALDAAGREDEALVELREVLRLDPTRDDVEVMIATLLVESGAEAEAMRAIETMAGRQEVDLESVRHDLDVAGMPADAMTLLQNAFIHARNFMRSWLEDEVERVLQARDPEGAERRREAELRECQEMQAAVEQTIDPGHVPLAFRSLLPWASRIGVGDDICRRLVVSALTGAERAEVMRRVQAHGPEIAKWLDSFGSEPLSPEAASFMYLLLGMEEMRY